jgi:hypothetical protein
LAYHGVGESNKPVDVINSSKTPTVHSVKSITTDRLSSGNHLVAPHIVAADAMASNLPRHARVRGVSFAKLPSSSGITTMLSHTVHCFGTMSLQIHICLF